MSPRRVNMAQLLIIEDDLYTQNMITTLLERNGHNVKAVFDGFEGLKELKDNVYAAVIIDMHLADIDGPTIFKKMREDSITIPVIGISGGGGFRTGKDMSLLEKVENHGIFATFQKPFDHKEFIQAVQEATELC